MVERIVSIDPRGNEDYTHTYGEMIVRCRDCANANEFDDADEGYAAHAGKLDCRHFSQWDYYDDVPGSWPVEPDGFCSWGERRDA